MVKYISWIVLNIQLAIGFLGSYNFINRALIKKNYLLFIIYCSGFYLFKYLIFYW